MFQGKRAVHTLSNGLRGAQDGDLCVLVQAVGVNGSRHAQKCAADLGEACGFVVRQAAIGIDLSDPFEIGLVLVDCEGHL